MCELLDAIKKGVEHERIETAEENGILLTPDNIEDGFGSLHKYANTDLIPSEEGAWANAAAEKHSQNRK